jgi:choline kinase
VFFRVKVQVGAHGAFEVRVRGSTVAYELRGEACLTVTHAIILAAGNGDRFCRPGESKLVKPVLGIPLIARTLRSAAEAGIAHADVVLGYGKDEVRAVAERYAPEALSLHFHVNERWHEENGLSVLAARERHRQRRFAVLMGDHLFESAALSRLLAEPAAGGESLLGVDRRPAPADVAEEATRVRLDVGGWIVDIGKLIEPYDGLDTGLFVCTPALFDAIDESCAAGDTTLSGGIRRLAERRLIRGVDLGHTLWYDIDTAADLQAAEDLLQQPA